MLEGETIHSGAADTCTECGVKLVLEVLSSPAGWYIGTRCNCGPYSRESRYYSSYNAAKFALEFGHVDWRT